MSWTVVNDQEQYERALTLARGRYQYEFLQGQHNLSGSTLQGKARQYSGKYASSRDALLARLRNAGIAVSEKTGTHNKRILVIG